MKFIHILLAAILVFASSPVQAASSSEPAYRKFELFHSDLSDIGIRLAIDENLCKKTMAGNGVKNARFFLDAMETGPRESA